MSLIIYFQCHLIAISPLKEYANVPYTQILFAVLLFWSLSIRTTTSIWIQEGDTNNYYQWMATCMSTPKLSIWPERNRQTFPEHAWFPAGHVLPMFGHLEIKLWLHEVMNQESGFAPRLSQVPRYACMKRACSPALWWHVCYQTYPNKPCIFEKVEY